MLKTILPIILITILVSGLVFGIYDSRRDGYSAGWIDGYNSYEPKIITETEVIVVEIVKEVEVIKEVPIRHYIREFQDLKQLSNFIKNLDVEAVKKPWWDCDDYAYFLWTEAIRSGFLMSFESEELNGKLHALNNTVIGNTVYFIDLQAKKIWTRGWLD